MNSKVLASSDSEMEQEKQKESGTDWIMIFPNLESSEELLAGVGRYEYCCAGESSVTGWIT
jgi:hypothetical protein